MIIGTFNTDNTDPKKAVPDTNYTWTPDGKWNKGKEVKVIGRHLKPGEIIDFQSESGTGMDFRRMFSATVKEIKGMAWKDAKTGKTHDLDVQTFLNLPVTSNIVAITEDIIYGWGNAVMSANNLNEDEVKNSDSATKQAG